MSDSRTAMLEARNRLRAVMPVTKKWTYFDHAAMAPLPTPAADVLRKWIDEAENEGTPKWPEWVAQVERMRADAARLVGADADEIALVRNTTYGISLVAEGLSWNPGDNVVTLADEFPSNMFPWLQLADRGVETRRVPTDNGRLNLDDLAAACDARTRLVSVSWVGYATGYRHDIEKIVEIAHARGALMFLDAIQGLGAFSFDVRKVPVDFLAADGHKWLLGPEGAGIAYIKREHLDRVRPFGVGWHSVVPAGDYSKAKLEYKPTAARFEGGSENMAGMLALGATMDLLLSLGMESVSASVLDFTDQACDRLAKMGATVVSDRRMDHRGGEQRSGIVAFEMPGRDSQELRKHCFKHGIALSCRSGRLRISPHAYNNEEDLDRLVESLKSFQS